MPSITTDIAAHLIDSGFDGGVARELAHHSHITGLQKGEVLFRAGDVCDSFILVISGNLKVQKLTPDGHEIVLYRVDKGEECTLTSTCLLGGHYYPAEVVAESESEVLLLSRSHFFQLLEQQPLFRSMIYKNIEHSMSGLLDLVEEVAFDQMDHRLATALLKQSHSDAIIQTTHHDLASDLGTAREVVSRLLKEFEHHGWVKLHRGSIEIVDRDALAKL
jgi:CRP/FNR family transcriptional regulator